MYLGAGALFGTWSQLPARATAQLRAVARFPPLFIAVASMRWFVSSSWMPLGVVVRAWFAYRSLVSVSYVATLRSRVLHS